MCNFLFKIQEHSGDGGKNDQCVNVPSGVFTINSMSSSFPVCAFIYTKNNSSSYTSPLNSQQYTSVFHFVGINACRESESIITINGGTVIVNILDDANYLLIQISSFIIKLRK